MEGIKAPLFAGVFDEPVEEEEICKDPEVEGIHFSGPHYIRNSEGAIAEVTLDNKGTVNSATFSGDRNQQAIGFHVLNWILHRHPNKSESKVAVISFHDGRYLTASGTSCESSEVYVDKEPFYWKLATIVQGVYSLEADSPLGQLRIPATGPCTITDFDDENNLKQVDLIIVQKTPESDASLLPVTVIEPPPAIESEPEPWTVVPDAPVPENEVQHSYTAGSRWEIKVANHLDTDINVAVTGSGGNRGQIKLKAKGTESWNRIDDQKAHVSLPGSLGGQTACVLPAPVGKILHIAKLPFEAGFKGIPTVASEQARYLQLDRNPQQIWVQNNLGWEIYVAVLGSVQNIGNTHQRSIWPGLSDKWQRSTPETVLVSVGSAPGTVRAYIGHPGYILHIDDWS
ncbi:hypothetical protein D9611_002837 [Ephemerocybe angulata]|uniref:Uncharacterized protein n=1 Tax=Ephemerocybe angulata TaxID=980116 RepID=A0A8H5C423_9AGAR|nr:hypothetical protein D9611_002837 [Tulosesus angulatus]